MQIKERLKNNAKESFRFVSSFIKWGIVAVITGLIGGAVGTLFHLSVEWATAARGEHAWLIWLLPVGGLVIAFLYHITRMRDNRGTDHVISAVRTSDPPPAVMAPLIFIATVLTHLFGGSAGREGAALQLGGSIAAVVGRLLRLDKRDMSILIMGGMSGVFAALFGTPLTAAFFAMEVISVGQIYYAALIPCMASSLTAYGVSVLCGVAPVHFSLSFVPEVGVLPILEIVALSVLCALLSIVFCRVMKGTHRYLERWIPNAYLRIAAGGLCVALLTVALGTHDYNGAGMDVIARAIGGQARPWDFIVKLVFTAITIGAGFRGGEIVPTFFVGATFGCVAGGLIGIDPGFGAAVGLVATFCGVVNCPIASIFSALSSSARAESCFLPLPVRSAICFRVIAAFTAAKKLCIRKSRPNISIFMQDDKGLP